MTPEEIFENANAGGRYEAHRQKTGFQLRFEGKPVGGWEDLNCHWYILNPFASTVEHHKAILSRHGFEQQKMRHRWWWLRGAANAVSFRHAVEDLTGMPFMPNALKRSTGRGSGCT